MTSYTLRPYQTDAVAAGLAYLRDATLRGRHGIVVAPTGSGKSLEIASIATALLPDLDGVCLVFQPSKEILEQNLTKLAHYGYRPSVFSASMGRKEIGPITLATIGSVIRHIDVFAQHVRFVLADECHVVSARGGMYHDFLTAMPEARILGFTATPYRLASNSFGSQLRFLTRTRPRIFRDVVHYTQIGDLFALGYLAPLQYRDVAAVPRERLKLNSTGADYTDQSVLDLFGEVGFVGQLQREVEYELAQGRKNVLVFTRFVDEARRLARAVPGAAVVTAETPAHDREQILTDYKRGRIRVVANVGIVALGFDYPELECVILARPSVSLGLYYQQVGRIIRPHPQKPIAHVVDMVGLVRQFGRIEDLTLRAGGERGDLWTVCAHDRPLSNVYFAERDDINPAAVAKATAKRRYWAQRRRRA